MTRILTQDEFFELVETITPFVKRYATAHPNLVRFWFEDARKLEQLDAIMADWWEWVRRGNGGQLFQGYVQRDVGEAFEVVLQTMKEDGNGTNPGIR